MGISADSRATGRGTGFKTAQLDDSSVLVPTAQSRGIARSPLESRVNAKLPSTNAEILLLKVRIGAGCLVLVSWQWQTCQCLERALRDGQWSGRCVALPGAKMSSVASFSIALFGRASCCTNPQDLVIFCIYVLVKPNTVWLVNREQQERHGFLTATLQLLPFVCDPIQCAAVIRSVA